MAWSLLDLPIVSVEYKASWSERSPSSFVESGTRPEGSSFSVSSGLGSFVPSGLNSSVGKGFGFSEFSKVESKVSSFLSEGLASSEFSKDESKVSSSEDLALSEFSKVESNTCSVFVLSSSVTNFPVSGIWDNPSEPGFMGPSLEGMIGLSVGMFSILHWAWISLSPVNVRVKSIGTVTGFSDFKTNSSTPLLFGSHWSNWAAVMV